MELIVQPEDGIEALLTALKNAEKTIDIIIFRFDLKSVEKAIVAAVARGVVVRALIAHTNSGGERRLRELEQRMLAAGVSVSRTADDLVRYHGKFLIVDGAELHVYGFNFTSIDSQSRSFGIICQDRRCIQEAVRLFEADAIRQEFEPELDSLVVSPENAREQLATFLKRAKKQLLIYDPKLSDPQMIRLLVQRIKAGGDEIVIGKVGKRAGALKAEKFPGKRLHVRAMARDGDTIFVGSQSLRALELDGRREVGLISKDAKMVKRLVEVFEADWSKTARGEKEQRQSAEPQLAEARTG